MHAACARSEAARFMGFHPAALLMADCALPAGLRVIRASLDPLLRPMPSAPAAFGDLIADAMVRLFGLRLPRPLSVAFAIPQKAVPRAWRQCTNFRPSQLPPWRLCSRLILLELPIDRGFGAMCFHLTQQQCWRKP